MKSAISDNVAVIRVGVVADTHCPEFMDELPPALLEGLAGVDLILHAGDISAQATLDRLAEIAPVEAVRGDHDRSLTELPRSREVEVAGRRIAIVHGNRSRLVEEPVTLFGTLSLGLVWPDLGLARQLARRFPEADLVVYGHTHRARTDLIGSRLVFNPGAVYQVTRREARRRLRRRPDWFAWCWLQVIRHRRDDPLGSYGILEIDDQVRGRCVRLPRQV